LLRADALSSRPSFVAFAHHSDREMRRMLTETRIHSDPARRPPASSWKNQALVRKTSGTLPTASSPFDSGDGAMTRYGRNQEIFCEGDPAEYLYKILDGAVRKYILLSDGRRQIAGFYLAGEMFGLELGDRHGTSADAITASSILTAKRTRVLRCAEDDRDVARWLWSITARELRRSEHHALLLIKNARERVAAFLIDMADRFAEDTFELPMSRREIADYLGLTIETVCRILNQFSDTQVIELGGMRRIVLHDRAALRELNQ
jgi:CRP/FNR family nitrogen fixation transcriptional regulator